MYLLDTNIVSELRKSKPHGAVLAWYRAQQFEQLFLPAIVFYELQAGIELTRAQNPVRARELEFWMVGLPAIFNVLAMDHKAARIAGKLMHRQSPHLFEDALIASIAIANNDLTVVTRNTRDFSRFPVAVLNPFVSGQKIS
jgi:hypothetical protein